MLRGSNRNVLIQVCARCGKHAWTYSPRPAFLAHTEWHFDLQISLALILFCVTSGEAQVEKRVGKCAAQWTSILSIHLGPQHPASLLRCPVVLWSQQLPLLWEQHQFVKPTSDLHTGGYIQRMLVVLWSFAPVCVCSLYSDSAGQGQYVISVSVFFSLPVIFHCLTESQFIYPFSLDHFQYYFNKLCFCWKKEWKWS